MTTSKLNVIGIPGLLESSETQGAVQLTKLLRAALEGKAFRHRLGVGVRRKDCVRCGRGHAKKAKEEAAASAQSDEEKKRKAPAEDKKKPCLAADADKKSQLDEEADALCSVLLRQTGRCAMCSGAMLIHDGGDEPSDDQACLAVAEQAGHRWLRFQVHTKEAQCLSPTAIRSASLLCTDCHIWVAQLCNGSTGSLAASLLRRCYFGQEAKHKQYSQQLETVVRRFTSFPLHINTLDGLAPLLGDPFDPKTICVTDIAMRFNAQGGFAMLPFPRHPGAQQCADARLLPKEAIAWDDSSPVLLSVDRFTPVFVPLEPRVCLQSLALNQWAIIRIDPDRPLDRTNFLLTTHFLYEFVRRHTRPVVALLKLRSIFPLDSTDAAMSSYRVAATSDPPAGGHEQGAKAAADYTKAQEALTKAEADLKAKQAQVKALKASAVKPLRDMSWFASLLDTDLTQPQAAFNAWGLAAQLAMPKRTGNKSNKNPPPKPASDQTARTVPVDALLNWLPAKISAALALGVGKKTDALVEECLTRFVAENQSKPVTNDARKAEERFSVQLSALRVSPLANKKQAGAKRKKPG